MVRTKVYLFVNQFKGLPKLTDFKLVEENLPDLKDGEFLVEANYLSVDPYMRSFSKSFKLGKPLIGEQVGRITESKNTKYPKGQYVVGDFGWTTYTNAKDERSKFGFPPPRLVPDIGGLPKSLALGVLGITGHTAYFALLEICKPKKGDTVVVSSAGGAVGSHAGQIAKIMGCSVIGITGSDEKGKWLVDELGFDAFVNYKKPDFAKHLSDATPNGIDCYFDNVGGEISSVVINQMNQFGRIAVCGSISTYNYDIEDLPKASEIQTPVKIKHIRMEGFSVFKYSNRWQESLQQNLKWIQEGKLKYKETVYEGFEKMVEAFIGLLEGKNFGKSIIKV